MQIFRANDTLLHPADASWFDGRVQIQKVGSAEEGVAVQLFNVAFDANGRTHWHRHSGPQWLLVMDGRIRVQCWGEPSYDLATGDAVVIAPNEKHWHGAAPGSHGRHLAINVSLETDWLEPVADPQ
jgi:quercetin dioxygenase-like cupin family protein